VGIKATIVDARGNPIRSNFQTRALAKVRARYDASVTVDENRKHWANADGLSARSANTPQVRATLRNRARYEIANNTYANGIGRTLANDTVGTGPRLQLLTDDDATNERIEKSFSEWSDEIRLPEKLRTMRFARYSDGESFALLDTNERLTSPVQLDIRLIEADQCATPDLFSLDGDRVDGIRFDLFGNPISYDILTAHPGDALNWTNSYETVPARLVLHWFQADRPGQQRGISELTPALPLFAQLRRYTLAVLAAAETAADFAAILYSDMAPEDADDVKPFDSVEIERRMMTTLPGGWKMEQFKAEQPATTYPAFKAEILNEISRVFSMPYNVVAGNSSGYNYASGRLDFQTYFRVLRVEQSHLQSVILDPLWRAWLDEMTRTTNLVPGGADRLGGWPHQWFWDGGEHVDPAKEAAAQKTRFENNTTTLANEYARQGLDWEAQLRQRAKEQRLIAELGLVAPALAPVASSPPYLEEKEDDEPEDEDE
jgi:lambda family phage portal protein